MNNPTKKRLFFQAGIQQVPDTTLRADYSRQRSSEWPGPDKAKATRRYRCYPCRRSDVAPARCGGCTPMPRKLSADTRSESLRQSPALPPPESKPPNWKNMHKDNPQITCPDRFGGMNKTRSGREIKSARTSRVTPIQPVTPIMIMIFQMEGSRKAMTARMRKNVGKQSIISTKRIITESTQPP